MCSITKLHVRSNLRKKQKKQMHLLYSYTDLMTDTWKQGKALSATHTPEFNSHAHHKVQNPWHKLDDKCLCLSYVFSSILACAKSSYVFQKLSYSLCGLLSNNSSSGTKTFLRFIAFSGSQTAVHRPLHALQYYTVSIPFWTARKRQSNITVTYVLQRGIRKHIVREENGWLSHGNVSS